MEAGRITEEEKEKKEGKKTEEQTEKKAEETVTEQLSGLNLVSAEVEAKQD